MYRLLILEDEIWISSLIQSFVNNNFDNISIIGCCSNGTEALKKISAEKPDITLVDINVPILNGLNVIAQAQKQGLPCRFVIITGYKDFDYVHESLKFGVDDYLLKPVDENELCDVLQRIIDKLYHDRTEKEAYIQNSNLLKAHFLKQVLLHPSGDNSTLDDCSQYGFAFDGELFCCGIFKLIHQQLNYILPSALESFLNRMSDFTSDSFSVLCHDYFYFHQGSLIILVLNLKAEMKHQLSDWCRLFFQNLLTYAQTMSLNLSAGFGALHSSGLSGLQESYLEASHALRSRISLGLNREIIYGEDISSDLITTENLLPADEIHKLTKIINTQDNNALLYWFRHIINDYSARISFQETETLPLLPLLNQVADAFCTEVNKLQVIKADKSELLDKLDMCSTVTELCTNFIDQLKELNSIIAGKLSENNTNTSITLACQYINQHLADPLTLDSVASQIYLNSTYLSELFKSETGMNFKDYILEKRMTLAGELLRTPLKISEIAARVGYSDPKHFSKSFKKYTGISPKDYQRIHT